VAFAVDVACLYKLRYSIDDLGALPRTFDHKLHIPSEYAAVPFYVGALPYSGSPDYKTSFVGP